MAVEEEVVAAVVAEEEVALEEVALEEVALEEAVAAVTKEENVAVQEAEEEPEEPTSWLRGGLDGTAAPGLSAVLAWLASSTDEPSQPARAERTLGRAGTTPRLATRAAANTPRSATRSAASAAAAAEEGGGGGWRGAKAIPETPPRTPGARAGFDFSELKRISFLRTPPSAHGARVSRVFQQPSHQQRDVHTWLTSVDEAPSAPAMFAGLEAVSESPPAALDAAAGPALARGSSLPLKPPPARRTAAGAPPSNASRAAAPKPALGSRIGVPASARAGISANRAAIQGSSRAVVRPRTSKLSLSASASSLPAPKSRR